MLTCHQLSQRSNHHDKHLCIASNMHTGILKRFSPRLEAESVPSQQFQALFDSLSKVLFIFPSRYLFAIGLSPRILPWMELTTLDARFVTGRLVFGLHSQTARLLHCATTRFVFFIALLVGRMSFAVAETRCGTVTLAGRPFQSSSVSRPGRVRCRRLSLSKATRRVFPLSCSFKKSPGSKDARFLAWALPCSLAVTEGILVGFFSSAE